MNTTYLGGRSIYRPVCVSISSKDALPVQGKADTVIELVSYRSEQKCGSKTQKKKNVFASGLDSLKNVVYSSV